MIKEFISVFNVIRNKANTDYTIEHHLKNSEYYPKCGDMYMIRNRSTLQIDLVEKYMYQYSMVASSIEQATGILNEYKRQKELEKIETIKVD